MNDFNFHLRFPRLYTLWQWVLNPRAGGEHYGFRNWVRYCFRRRDE